MKRHIWLRDLEYIEYDTDMGANREYGRKLLDAARKDQSAKGLRFDNRTGKLHRNDVGELKRYSNPSHFVPHTKEEDVFRWEFSRHINNKASRLHRGVDKLPT